MAYLLEYLGGIPEMNKTGSFSVKVTSGGLRVSAGMFKKVEIPHSSVLEVSLKTDEQISKDVTITRMLALGIFAFGAKKKRKTVTNNLVVEYIYGDLVTAAVFSGDEVPSAHSDFLKSRAKYLKKNPAPVRPAQPEAGSSGDTASEIERFKGLLDSGAITQDEYDAKKKQLLGL